MKIFLESLDNSIYTEEQLISLIYENILERNEIILTAVSNGFLSAKTIGDNISIIKDFIANDILPEVESYCKNNNENILNFSSYLYILPSYINTVKKLNNIFNIYNDMQNKVWDSDLSFLGESKCLEGVFTDFFNLFTDIPNLPKDVESQLDIYLHPYSINDLYGGIVSQLKQSRDKTIKDEIMPLFFTNEVNKKIVNSDFLKYRERSEDVIIDFIVKDCTNIIKKTLDDYTSQNSKISENRYYGKVCFDAVLNQVKLNTYELEDKLIKIYREYKDKVKVDDTAIPKNLTYKDLSKEQQEIYDSLKDLTSANTQDLINIVAKVDASDKEKALLKTLQQLNSYINV